MTYHRLRVGLLILAALIDSYILFVPPVIGLANQSDFARLMDPFGIAYPPNLTVEQHFWCFTDVHFILTQPQPQFYLTSQLPFVSIAYELNHLLSKPGAFDIRALSTVELAVLLFLFWRLAGLVEEIGGRGRVAGLVLVTLVVTDLRNLAFFNTFYCEPAVFLFGIAFVLCLFQSLRNPSARAIWLLAVSSALLVTSKPQHAATGVVIGSCLMTLPFVAPDWRRHLRLCLAAGAIVGAAVLVSVRVGNPLKMSPLYNTIFNGLLRESENPARDLAAIGIDPAAQAYRGTNAFMPNRAGPSLFPGTATYPKLFGFYLLRPRYLARRAAKAITDSAMSNEILDLGNFERGRGYPCRAHAFSLWDSMRSWIGRPRMIQGFFLITIPAALFLGIRRKSACALGYVVLGSLAISTFFVTALADGMDHRRHLFFFHLLFDCCLCCVVLYVADRLAGMWRRTRKTGRPTPASPAPA